MIALMHMKYASASSCTDISTSKPILTPQTNELPMIVNPMLYIQRNYNHNTKKGLEQLSLLALTQDSAPACPLTVKHVQVSSLVQVASNSCIHGTREILAIW